VQRNFFVLISRAVELLPGTIVIVARCHLLAAAPHSVRESGPAPAPSGRRSETDHATFLHFRAHVGAGIRCMIDKIEAGGLARRVAQIDRSRRRATGWVSVHERRQKHLWLCRWTRLLGVSADDTGILLYCGAHDRRRLPSPFRPQIGLIILLISDKHSFISCFFAWKITRTMTDSETDWPPNLIGNKRGPKVTYVMDNTTVTRRAAALPGAHSPCCCRYML